MRETERPLAGRVALVTGANSGIGRITARELAARGAHVFIACRSRERADPALAEIRAIPEANVESLTIDLGDFDSVRACAAAFLDRGLPLHLLVNNAGVVPRRGSISKSGFELAFGVNHLGHFLLTQLLLARMRESAPSRVVTITSDAHRHAQGFDWRALREPTRSISGFPEYCASKLANVLFSAELARRVEGSGMTSYAVHPGVVASDIWRRVPAPARALIKLFMLSAEEGAQTTLHCATSDEAARETGFYYADSRIVSPGAPAQNRTLALELWERSEAWTHLR